MKNSQILSITLILLISLLLAISLLYARPYLRSWIYKAADFLYNDAKSIELIELMSSPYDQLIRPENTRSEYILTLYQIIKDIHDIFDIVGIEYWADFGTLLGAVRHKGIIPWDDDGDLSISIKDQAKLMNCVVPVLKKLNYGILLKNGYITVVAHAGLITLLPDEKYPGCDIFLAQEIDGKLVLTGWPHTIEVIDWKPLKKYHFGSFYIWGQANPIPYLNSLFGKNWKTLAIRGGDHKTVDSRESSGMPFLINDADYLPAKPLGPLIDHRDEMKKLLQEIDSGCL
ncbi:LicD superfamily domain containing protein [Candidatus Trichorickettsia mobilis]|uniref:LicD superfamily domain containing protein n=1 Tax=Candidatus Trichorickettsia mobilis TaxID=1346319 RepID=A0ABZ0UWI7_9RICK|nr:LicD family protein [Candidatus Trichorickettsia mobilis]WPY01373.1 LicD superfamily domain containing protein [Candidatus Trichorickettsia mobilis]